MISLVLHPHHLDKKMAELDSDVQKIKVQRDKTLMGLKSNLQNNRAEQEKLRERLRQLEKEDKELSDKIKQNDNFQIEADQVLQSKSCKRVCYMYVNRSMAHVNTK